MRTKEGETWKTKDNITVGKNDLVVQISNEEDPHISTNTNAISATHQFGAC